MSWQEETLKRLDGLIEAGDGLRYDATGPGIARFTGWNTQVISALTAIVGPTDPYLNAFVQHSTDRNGPQPGTEILSRLRSDVENGYLRKTADIVSAEVFSDFLDMAQHLVDNNYHHPAASLAGAVLEDGLRRIARNHEITVTEKDDLSSLRTKCFQKQVFNKLVLQQIVGWTTLRNSADHGNFEAYTAQQVQSMISDVRSFLSNYLV